MVRGSGAKLRAEVVKLVHGQTRARLALGKALYKVYRTSCFTRWGYSSFCGYLHHEPGVKDSFWVCRSAFDVYRKIVMKGRVPVAKLQKCSISKLFITRNCDWKRHRRGLLHAVKTKSYAELEGLCGSHGYHGGKVVGLHLKPGVFHKWSRVMTRIELEHNCFTQNACVAFLLNKAYPRI